MHCRTVIERMFGRIKDWRRIATRYDRSPTVFLSAIMRGNRYVLVMDPKYSDEWRHVYNSYYSMK
jgi:hypothetical protein